MTSWVPIKRGDAIPPNAVMVGSFPQDGVVYVGRLLGEPGKINVDKHGAMWNFRAHHQTHSYSAEILTCTVEVSWKPIRKGEPIPGAAVQAGITPTDGIVYVGHLNSEPGKISTQDGDKMKHFWSHYQGKNESASILLVTSAPAAGCRAPALRATVSSNSAMHPSGPISNMMSDSSIASANFGGSGWSFPVWAIFDLGLNAAVGCLELKPHLTTGSPQRFSIAGGSSGSGPWHNAKTFAENAPWNSAKQFQLEGHPCRFWKLTVSASFDGNAPSLEWVKFYQREEREGCLPAPSSFPELRTLQIEELAYLKANRAARDDWLAALPQLRNIRGQLETVREGNLALANAMLVQESDVEAMARKHERLTAELALRGPELEALIRRQEEHRRQQAPGALLAAACESQALHEDNLAEELLERAGSLEAGALADFSQRYLQHKKMKHVKLAMKASIEQ
eukprot:TRINITY_DN33712_c0_g1_i1.p1 TRINITY_DN33712_c0_g1~~TRINITY_DN33712_c0_g1_i1.p1  ORF type:complete len:452 (-),score=80.61 TRINITY_DN33712_c0_g1_i1:243-1598(-)